MAKYKVLAGIHEGADKTKPITAPELDANGNPTGKTRPTGRFERKVYTAGQTVESDTDLCAKFVNKFAFVSGERPKASAPQGAVAPGGQVSSGLQETRGLRDDEGKPIGTVTGLKDETEVGEGGAFRPAAGKDADLDSKTVAELRELAEDEEIDLKGAHTKADIVKAIRSGR